MKIVVFAPHLEEASSIIELRDLDILDLENLINFITFRYKKNFYLRLVPHAVQTFVLGGSEAPQAKQIIFSPSFGCS